MIVAFVNTIICIQNVTGTKLSYNKVNYGSFLEMSYLFQFFVVFISLGYNK